MVRCFVSLCFLILPPFSLPSINHCKHLSFLPSSVFMSFHFLPVRLLCSKFHILIQTALCLCRDPPTEDLCVVRSSPTSLSLKNLHPCSLVWPHTWDVYSAKCATLLSESPGQNITSWLKHWAGGAWFFLEVRMKLEPFQISRTS